MTTSAISVTIPSPFHAQLREKTAAKRRAHCRKVFNEACRELADHMEGLGLAELYASEVTKGIAQSWTRVWDSLNSDRTMETIEFKVKNVTYWLTR